MYHSIFIHSRSASPTLRPPNPQSGIAMETATEPTLDNQLIARVPPAKFDGLLKRHEKADGTLHQKLPGQSFTTVSWPSYSTRSDLKHPHQVMDCGEVYSVELPGKILAKSSERQATPSDFGPPGLPHKQFLTDLYINH